MGFVVSKNKVEYCQPLSFKVLSHLMVYLEEISQMRLSLNPEGENCGEKFLRVSIYYVKISIL